LTPSPERSCPPKLFASTAETEYHREHREHGVDKPRRRRRDADPVERKRSREILASLPIAFLADRRRPITPPSRSPIKTMSADSMAMSVPAPMAMPMSACVSAGRR